MGGEVLGGALPAEALKGGGGGSDVLLCVGPSGAVALTETEALSCAGGVGASYIVGG